MSLPRVRDEPLGLAERADMSAELNDYTGDGAKQSAGSPFPKVPDAADRAFPDTRAPRDC